jgi:hypothetical protein
MVSRLKQKVIRLDCRRITWVHDRSCDPGRQDSAARGADGGAFGVPPLGG